MIPLRLQLKNFLSYGAELQTIDFEPYHLICLSGKNGHGKSALLDAITWAIWGIARKQSGNAKADQGLLRLGQKQMMVIFDFIFNDQTYRIRREFALTHGKPYACLEFGVLNRENDSVTPLTDKTIRSTQAKINQMLGLDYDAFTNSAFLRQGHANEFSKKSPKERKTILAQIIGLERFEILKKIAHETAREKQQKKSELGRLTERLDQELEKQDEFKKQMAVVTKNLTSYAAQENELKKQYAALEQTKKQLIADKQSYALLNQKRMQIKQDYAQSEQTFRSTATQWRSTHKQLLCLGDTNALAQEKKEITKTISDYQKRIHESFALKKELLQVQQDQQKIQADLTAKHTQMVSEKKTAIELLHGQKKTVDQQRTQINKEYALLTKEIAQLTSRIESHQKIINASITVQKLESFEKQFEKKRSYYHKWVARANMLTQKKNDIIRKKGLSSDNEQPSCPLCEQNLSASRKRFLLAKFDTEHAFLAHQLQRLTQVLKNLKIRLIDEHAQLETQRNTIKNNQLAQATLKELQKNQTSSSVKQKGHLQQFTMLEKQSKEIEATIQQDLKNLEKNSDTSSLTKHNKEYQAISQQREKVSKQIKALSVDETIYIAATKKLETIEKQLATLETITAQKHQQEQRKEIVFTAARRIRELTNLQNKQDSELKKFSSLAQDEKQINAQTKAVERQSYELSTTKAESLQQKGRLEAQLAKLAQYKKEQGEHQKAIKNLAAEIDEYQIIATALGKDGIQALLIEDAIPEIEQEANDLLAKLTDNQSQIFIESLKDLKKGGTKETLDIKISDAAGIRPYEMFSGGEAFRIDFALRIAISKLLARRAGTSLQTLIIDEGFGSQDEEGLAHIMDAIYKIQDDFSKVIIVSHLPAMKNQFPVHFVVQKDAQGSVIQVMEQG